MYKSFYNKINKISIVCLADFVLQYFKDTVDRSEVLYFSNSGFSVGAVICDTFLLHHYYAGISFGVFLPL